MNAVHWVVHFLKLEIYQIRTLRKVEHKIRELLRT